MAAPRWRCTAGGRRGTRAPGGGQAAAAAVAGAALVVAVAVVAAPVAAPLTSAPEPVAPLFGPNRLVATLDSGDVLGDGGVMLAIEELASGDLTGDGLDDVVVTRGRWSSPETFPITILVNAGDGRFTDRTAALVAGAVPRTQWARQTLLADLNGDGRLDIFVADTGTDVPPYEGHPDLLLLSAPDGRYHDASSTLPHGAGYTHSAAAGDVDGDGDIDLFVAPFRPELLLNDGQGRFELATGHLPPVITDADLWGRSELVDVDGDGALDLVLASHGERSLVARNDGAARFAEVTNALPPKPFGTDAIGIEIAPVELDGDGNVDLLLGYTKADPFYQGRWIQVLVNRGDGTFRDETAARLPQADNEEGWSYDLVVADLDGDGDEDFAVDLGAPFGDPWTLATKAPPFFLNRGDGTFHEVETSAFADPPTPWAEPPHPQLRFLDADGDGRLDIFSAWQPPWGDPEEYVVAYQLGRLRDLALACPAPPPAGFGDVSPGSPHALAVDCVVAWGVAHGTAAGHYAPAASVTRGQMASFLARLVEALGLALDPSAPDAFGDDGGSVHEPAIDRLAAAGIVRGVAPGRFAPGAAVTRGQMATLLVRSYEAAAGGALRRGPDAFRDDDGGAHEPSIDTAVEAGFATGTWWPGWRGSLPPVRLFEARDPVRRDQMATFLARVLDRGLDDGLTGA